MIADTLRNKFSSILNLSDLALFLHVSPAEMNYLLSHLECQYSHRTRGKADGSKRHLFIPSQPLKLLQKKIYEHTLSKVPLLACVYGGVKGKSVVQNASVHCRKDVVFKMDLEHCFPGIGTAQVRAIFQALGFLPEVVNILTKLTTWRNEIPQGVPTSTALANLALARIDGRITNLQRFHEFEYTRWVDDLTFSGGLRVLKLRRLFQRIVENEGFRISSNKTQTMLADEQQIVTNLVVNKKVNLSREHRAAIKKEIIQALANGQSFTPRLAGKLYWYRSVNLQAGNYLLQRAKDYVILQSKATQT